MAETVITQNSNIEVASAVSFSSQGRMAGTVNQNGTYTGYLYVEASLNIPTSYAGSAANALSIMQGLTAANFPLKITHNATNITVTPISIETSATVSGSLTDLSSSVITTSGGGYRVANATYILGFRITGVSVGTESVTFKWYTTSSTTSMSETSTISVTALQVAVIFDAGSGGTVNGNQTYTSVLTSGNTLRSVMSSLPVASKVDNGITYTSDGWYNGSTEITLSTTITSSITVTPHWVALSTISISLKSVVFSESDGRTHTLTAYSDKTSAMSNLHTEYWISSSCWLRPITDSDDPDQEFTISLYTSASPNTAITGAANVTKYVTGLSDGDTGYEGDFIYFIKDFSGVIEIRIEGTSTNAESVAYFGVKVIAGAKLTLRPNYISGTTAGTPNYSLNYIQAKNIASTIPANPFTYNHSLLGWSESSSATPETTPDYDDEATVTLGGDKVLYAVWNQYSNTKNTYSVYFQTGATTDPTGTPSYIKEYTFKASEADFHTISILTSIMLPDDSEVTPVGYSLEAWVLDRDGDTNIEEDYNSDEDFSFVGGGTFELWADDVLDNNIQFDSTNSITFYALFEKITPTSYPSKFYVVRSTNSNPIANWSLSYTVADSDVPERIVTTATFTKNPEYTRSVVIFYIPSSFTLPLGYIGWDGTSNTYLTDPMLLCLKDNKTFYLLSLDSDGDTRTITSKTITVSSSNYGTSISLLLTRN